jgi:hypothetical protein
MEDTQDQKKFIESIQKDLTKVCFKSCFQLNSVGLDGDCMESCYGKYLRTLNLVNDELKEHAHDLSSLYAFKIWPIIPAWSKAVHDEECFPSVYGNKPGNPIYEDDYSNIPIGKSTFSCFNGETQ